MTFEQKSKVIKIFVVWPCFNKLEIYPALLKLDRVLFASFSTSDKKVHNRYKSDYLRISTYLSWKIESKIHGTWDRDLNSSKITNFCIINHTTPSFLFLVWSEVSISFNFRMKTAKKTYKNKFEKYLLYPTENLTWKH